MVVIPLWFLKFKKKNNFEEEIWVAVCRTHYKFSQETQKVELNFGSIFNLQ